MCTQPVAVHAGGEPCPADVSDCKQRIPGGPSHETSHDAAAFAVVPPLHRGPAPGSFLLHDLPVPRPAGGQGGVAGRPPLARSVEAPGGLRRFFVLSASPLRLRPVGAGICNYASGRAFTMAHQNLFYPGALPALRRNDFTQPVPPHTTNLLCRY